MVLGLQRTHTTPIEVAAPFYLCPMCVPFVSCPSHTLLDSLKHKWWTHNKTQLKPYIMLGKTQKSMIIMLSKILVLALLLMAIKGYCTYGCICKNDNCVGCNDPAMEVTTLCGTCALGYYWSRTLDRCVAAVEGECPEPCVCDSKN